MREDVFYVRTRGVEGWFRVVISIQVDLGMPNSGLV